MKKILFLIIMVLLLSQSVYATITYDEGYYQRNIGTVLSAGLNDPIYRFIKEVADLLDSCLYGTAANRGPSPLIWDDCPVLSLTTNPTSGWIYFNDFINAPTLAANTSVYNNGLIGAWTGATAGTLTSTTDEPTGVIKLFTTTDNECTGIVICSSNGTAGHVDLVAATPKGFWLESRLKCINITDAKFGVFFGIGQEALVGATGVIADDGTIQDKDVVGFHKLEGDGDKFDTRYNTEGGGGVTTLKADAVTIVADTYLKLGIKMDNADKTVTFYSDGVALADTVEIDGTNFPDGEEMAIYILIKAAHADDAYIEVDWIRAAQLY